MRQKHTNGSDGRNSGGGAGSELDRFKRCVAALHRNILQGYDHWCEHVGLPMRIPAVAWSQLAGGRDNPRAPVRGRPRSSPLSIFARPRKAVECFSPGPASFAVRRGSKHLCGGMRVKKALSCENVELCGLECGRPLAHPGHLRSEERCSVRPPGRPRLSPLPLHPRPKAAAASFRPGPASHRCRLHPRPEEAAACSSPVLASSEVPV